MADDPWAAFVAPAPASTDPWAAFASTPARDTLIPPPELPTMPGAKGVVRGLRDIPDAGAQLLTRGLEAIAPKGSWFEQYMQNEAKRVDDINRTAEDDYQNNWQHGTMAGHTDVGRIVGNMVGTAPIAYAMPGAAASGLGARMLSGAASGAVTGALQPTTDNNDFWSQKLNQAKTGAIAGGATAPAVGAVAKIINPNPSQDVAALMKIGVRPTIGQIAGGSGGRIEEAAQSIPLLGDVIKGARTRAVSQFNRGVFDEALAPINQKLAPNTPLGHEAVVEASKKISDTYDTLLPKLQIKADPAFVTNLQSLVANSHYLPPGSADQFGQVLRGQVLSKFSPGGGMTGESFKEVESELGRLSSDYSHSAIASERQLGGAFRQLQAEMRDLLMRSNPAHATELGSINDAYSKMLRAQGAASKIGADQGLFTPAQLLSVVRELDPTLRKSGFAKGGAKMQDIADAGKSVLGSKLPDSGTPLRSIVSSAPVIGGAAYLNPVAAGATLAGGGAAALPYTSIGQSVLAHILAGSRPPIMQPASSGIRLAAPTLSPLAAALAQQPANP